MRNSIAVGLIALAATGSAMASPAFVPVRWQEYCRVLMHTRTVIKRVPAKRRPLPQPEVRYVSAPCVPMGIQTPPVNTAFTIEDQDIPWLAGATRNPPSHYRVDYGYPVAPVTGTTPPSSVPEPASWAMMVAGFGIVGGVMRRRKGVLA